MKTLVWVEHEGGAIKDATLSAVTAAGKLGEVHLLVAGQGVDGHARILAQRAPGDHTLPPSTGSATGSERFRSPSPCSAGFGSGNQAVRRRRRELPTTSTELAAIAAPAIIGLSRPAAASGIAATL